MEQWFDDRLMWTLVWLLVWVYCWVTWWRSTVPRPLLSRTTDSTIGQCLRAASTPIAVTFQMLKRAAEVTVLNNNDQEIGFWLKKIEIAGLQVVEASAVRSQLKLTNLLGEGTYGKVYQIQLADVDYPICIKVAKGIRRRECNIRECELLAYLQDVKGVPNVLGVSLRPDAFIMTMHGRVTLAKYIRPKNRLPSEKMVLGVLRDLCGVLASIHLRGLCHNDIKLNNVMVEVASSNKFTVTLIDFGLMSRHGLYPFGCARRGRIKPFYDPELMRREKPCSEATDMYSMGYLLHVILFCLPTTERYIERLCALATGPDYQRPSFSQMEDMFKTLAE